jgi:hypothetical protein
VSQGHCETVQLSLPLRFTACPARGFADDPAPDGNFNCF